MLGRLIRYEFRASGRLIPIVYAVVGLLAVSGLLLSLVDAYIYMGLSFLLLFLAGAAAMIITYVVIISRFYRGLFGAEGYLSMTLPVTSQQLYLSKTIVGLGWLLLSTVVTVCAWLIAMFSLLRIAANNIEFPRDFLQEMGRALQVFFGPSMLVFFVFSMLVSFLLFLAQAFFCITLSNVKPFHKLGIGTAVLAFVGLQILQQAIGAGLALLLPLSLRFDLAAGGWSLSTQSMWNSLQTAGGSAFSIGLGAHFLSLAVALLLPILTTWLLDRKVNLK